LNLAVLNSIKNVPFVSEIETVVNKLYTFYQNLTKRLKELGRAAAMLETKILNFKHLHSVRWVSNKSRSSDWTC
jgi:hypothetical protein